MSGFVSGPSNGKRRGRTDRRPSSSASPRPKKTRKVSDEAFVPASASESDEIEELSPNNAISGPGPGTLRYREERARQEEVALDDPPAANGDDFDNPFGRPQSRSSEISPDIEKILEGPSKAEGQLQAIPWKQEKRVSTPKHHFPRRVISTDKPDEEGTDVWEGISAVRQSLIPVEKAVQSNSVLNEIEGKGGGTGTPGTSIEHAIPIDENIEDVPQIANTIHSTSSVSRTKSSKGGAEEDPIEDSDHEKEELAELDGIPMHQPTVERNGFGRHAISVALSPSVPAGKVKDIRQIFETMSNPTASSSSTLLPVYGQHSSTKTPIPVPQAGSRGPAASGLRSQQKLSRSMGTRGDSTSSTSNNTATSSAIKARGKPVSASRKSKADLDSLLPIKKMYCCGKASESVSNTASQQYFLQWTPNALYITDQARLEAPFPTSRRLGKAERYTFMWMDLRDIEFSNTPGVIPTILSFRLLDRIRGNLGLKGENDQFVLEFDIDHDGWDKQRYDRMKAQLRSAIPRAIQIQEVDHSGSVAVLESARLQIEPFATEDENALASSSREFRTGVQLRAGDNVLKSSKTQSDSAKPAPLRLRDRAARSRMEDRSTDSDEAKSRAESDGISSTAREDGAELRRSRRQRAAPPAVNLNDNELLFSYPPVNITRGDLCRLEPDEFLNDTLIEFGLKLWQNDLKEKDPRLADDIWVFNSFFYKKLSNKKLEGYSSVKKWTAKVDIFRKKFIVVPINENLHWYLAIIYRPGASLHPVAQPQVPGTPPMTRASLKQVIQALSQPVKSASPSPPAEMEAASVPNTDIEDSMEVDQELLGGNDALKSPIEARGPSSPSVVGHPTNMDVDELEEGVAADDEGDVEMSSRFPEQPIAEASFRTPDAEGPRGLLEYASPDEEPIHGVPRTPRPPDLIQIAKGVSLRPDTSSDDISLDGDPRNVADEDTKLTGPEPQSMGQGEQTHIFILDSLGSKHPSVFNTLREWLSLEAEDKRKEKIPKTAAASGKYVKVPYQPNHVDCGVYLLHFAETFVAKADEIITLTLNTRKMDDASLRDKIFDKEVLKKKRAMLKDRVIEMAKAWKVPHSEAVPISTEKSLPDAPSHQPESKTGLAKVGVAQQSSVIEVPAETVSEGTSDPERGDESARGATNDPSPLDSAIAPTFDTDVGEKQQKPPPGFPEPTEESDDEIQFIGHHKPAQQARTKPSRTASTKAKSARHKG